MKTATLHRLLWTAALLLSLTACSKDSQSDESGRGGSMARFTIKDNYLYAVDIEKLSTFNIADPQNVNRVNVQYLGFGIETIFPQDDLLFIGAQAGMHIYGLTNPERPDKKSFTSHFRSYDPVVVQDNHAYVTLRSGVGQWGVNALLIFNISNIYNPQRVKEYAMTNPRGLGIDGNLLFVCDDGLKVFQVNNNVDLVLLHSFNIPAIDVIPDNPYLYVVTEQGLAQYKYENNNLVLLSQLGMNTQTYRK
ncbi:MAG TPA: hypothetical protein PKE03_02580 [Bacteroidales bacterium]|nr:hypothetical protein [Bacteroidales bacterium]